MTVGMKEDTVVGGGRCVGVQVIIQTKSVEISGVGQLFFY